MKTVKVRIAVVVDEAGRWNAAGWTGSGPEDVKHVLLDGFEPEGRERISYVEAEVPLPEPATTVRGEVVE